MSMWDFENAFEPMTESVIYKQDRPPFTVSTIKASIIQGQSQSESAGNSRGQIAANPWNVIISNKETLSANIREGDTLTARDGFLVLSVQQITKTELGLVLVCTSKASAPRF